MRIDGGLGIDQLNVAEAARSAEAMGYDGFWSGETNHDPFLPLVLAAEHTTRLQLGTGIAVAFARNPMNLAVVANDLQLLSGGRFMLGLGSQVKPHIEKRYSMPWSRPAARMREMVLAIRAIWSCWADSTPLRFRGEFYTHLLMTPMFDPGPNPFGNPRVFVAAVGEQMTEVAGEVADGLLAHAFTTERYLREVTFPAFERGLAKAGKSRTDVEISCPGMVATGATEEELAVSVLAAKRQIAFYGSTPAYRPVLALHGWEDLHDELHVLSKRGAWETMGDLVDDEVLDAFAVVGPLDEMATKIRGRFEPLVDRFSIYAPGHEPAEHWRPVVAALRQATT